MPINIVMRLSDTNDGKLTFDMRGDGDLFVTDIERTAADFFKDLLILASKALKHGADPEEIMDRFEEVGREFGVYLTSDNAQSWIDDIENDLHNKE